MIADLRASLASPALERLQPSGDGPLEALGAALGLAVALGRCRRANAEPGPDLDGTLLPHLVRAAALALRERAEANLGRVRELPALWDGDNWLAGEEAALDLLDARTRYWMAEAALDEGLQAARHHGTPLLAAVEEAMAGAAESLARFDAALREQLPLLTAVTATHLLTNTRQQVSARQRESLPWWLDGRLERLAEEQLDEADRSVEELRQAVNGLVTWVSPCGQFEARLTVTVAGRASRLQVTAVADGLPAVDLLPASIRLAGRRFRLDDQAGCCVLPSRLTGAWVLAWDDQPGDWTRLP